MKKKCVPFYITNQIGFFDHADSQMFWLTSVECLPQIELLHTLFVKIFH